MANVERFYATGKRKNAIARVWLYPGDGTMTINDQPAETYFSRETLSLLIRQPLELTGHLGKVNVKATVCGGGLSGQAGAVRHGIAKALVAMDPDLRPRLKKEGLLTRDPRVKERKKYGQPGARKRYQFSKR